MNNLDNNLDTRLISAVTNLFMNLKRIWGGIFRFLFITSVGIIGWVWLDPPTINDIPLSQLTLDHIFKNIAAFGIGIGCVRWLINTPDVDDDPYIFWADSSGILLGLIVIIYIFWG